MEQKPSDRREALWRRPLTEAERADAPMEPEAELEVRLTDSLAKLPDVPVASNFTARVMAAVDSEASRPAKVWFLRWDWSWRVFLPRLAAPVAVVALVGIGLMRYETGVHRELLAKNVAQVALNQAVLTPDVLKNFDAIRRMSQPVDADKDLLALMQ